MSNSWAESTTGIEVWHPAYRSMLMTSENPTFTVTTEGADVRGEEYLRFQEFFEYFILFFSPIVLASSVIAIISGFLTIKGGKDSKFVYICLFNIALADYFKCVAVLFELVEINNINYKFFCAWKVGK